MTDRIDTGQSLRGVILLSGYCELIIIAVELTS
jgi:hypothetical protein